VKAEELPESHAEIRRPPEMQIVVVAPAKTAREKLSVLGEVKVEPMPSPPPARTNW
jgi:hypothetical protein